MSRAIAVPHTTERLSLHRFYAVARYGFLMAYAFQADEPVPEGVRRILREQIDRARSDLTDPALPEEKRVHEARKRLKETRALLRLVRKPLGDRFRAESTSFRDIARDLSAARDRAVTRDTLAKLGLGRLTERRVRRELAASSDPAAEAIPIEDIVTRLTGALVRVDDLPAMDDHFATIRAGLERTYRDGRKAMRRAMRDRDADSFHEWRKRAKDLWYHSRLLHDVWPDMMKPYAAILSGLSHALGEHHDVHVLLSALPDPPSSMVKAAGKLTRTRETEATVIGIRVYAEDPASWVVRNRKLWDAWRTR